MVTAKGVKDRKRTTRGRSDTDPGDQIIESLIRARRDQGITQLKLEELTGVKQPQIARTEMEDANPRVKTLLKLLAPLGKTLAVVPLDWNKAH